jgi:hypothetical protein
MRNRTLRLLPVLIVASILPAQQIQVRLNSRISSETARPGMAFQGVLMAPVQLNGNSCAKGSPVGGTVTKAERSGRLSSPGVLEIQPTWVACHGHRVPVSAEPIRLEGRSHTKNNAVLIGGGAGLGALLGGIFGGGKGAAIGAAAGAGAGTVGAAATGRHEAVIEPEAVVGWNVSPAAPQVQTASNQPSPRHYSDHHTPRHDRDADDDDFDRDDHDRGRYGNVRFTNHDRVYLSRCLVSNYRLPPGLAKQGKIPPGHARKMAQAGYSEIPYACTGDLSPIPDGYHRVIIDTRVVLLDAAQRVIDSFIWQAEARGE